MASISHVAWANDSVAKRMMQRMTRIILDDAKPGLAIRVKPIRHQKQVNMSLDSETAYDTHHS